MSQRRVILSPLHCVALMMLSADSAYWLISILLIVCSAFPQASHGGTVVCVYVYAGMCMTVYVYEDVCACTWGQR